jgi:hypothetical protein
LTRDDGFVREPAGVQRSSMPERLGRRLHGSLGLGNAQRSAAQRSAAQRSAAQRSGLGPDRDKLHGRVDSSSAGRRDGTADHRDTVVNGRGRAPDPCRQRACPRYRRCACDLGFRGLGNAQRGADAA